MRIIKLFTDNKFGIFVCTFVLIIPIASSLYYSNIKQQEIIHNIQEFKISQPMELLKFCDYEFQIEEVKETEKESKATKFIITAYDLSLSSCGKSKSHSAYGISRGGIDLRGQNYKTARIIATDPKIIPLGSKVRIKFLDEKHKKYNGIYISGDCGSAIKGNRIDIFIEDSGTKRSKEALEFGKVIALVEIINE